MKIPFGLTKIQAAIALWLIFSIPFVIYVAYSVVMINVIGYNYELGRSNAVMTLIQEVKKECAAVPIFAGSEKIEVVNVACLQQPGQEGAANAPQGAPTTPQGGPTGPQGIPAGTGAQQ